MKSKLPKRKAWKGAKMGGSHSPMRRAARNSSELKQIVSPRCQTRGHRARHIM
jgi:hypothetical protein